MALEGTIKVPAVGPVKKTWALGGLGILGIILGVAYWRHLKTKTAPAAGTAAAGGSGFTSGFTGGADPFPPDGTVGDPTDPNSTDPNTGMTYGNEQAGTGGGIFGGGGGGGTQGPGSFTSNAAWDQAAQSYLEGIGSNPQVVAAALGKYLHGDVVTPAQQTVIESATAAEGEPPVPGPGGFPPNIRLHHPGPPPAKKKVKVPDVTQKTYPFAKSILAKDGLKARRAGAGPAVVDQAPRAGTEVDKGSTVILHMGQFHLQQGK